MSWMLKKLNDFILWKSDWRMDHYFCEGVTSNGMEKDLTWFYRIWLALYYPIPQTDKCWCCASVRGMIYGFVIGVVTTLLILRYVWL